MSNDNKKFIHKMNVIKAFPDQRSGAAKILIRASSEKEDRVGEIILKSAFADPKMRDEFVDIGYLDYNHLTDLIDKEIIKDKPSGDKLVALQKAKAEAIIGYPVRAGGSSEFPSEYEKYGLQEDGFYIEGRLIPGNQYAETIKSALASGMRGWGASVSGTALKSDFIENRLQRIHLKKCAIQPLMESVNQDTSVHLLKSDLVELSNIQKSFFGEEDEPSGEHPEENGNYHELKRMHENLIQTISEDEEISGILIDKIFSDIKNRVKTGSMELRSSVIRDFITQNYGFIGDSTSELADTVLISLSGEV